jgi:hypothetical protein
VPCAPIEQAPDVTRANEALREQWFVRAFSDEAKPLVFRTEAVCRD